MVPATTEIYTLSRHDPLPIYSFSRPFQAEGISVPLSASIGVAAAKPGADRAHQLLSDADTAAFAAKGAGRDRVHVFSPGLREAARWRLEVANRLREIGRAHV